MDKSSRKVSFDEESTSGSDWSSDDGDVEDRRRHCRRKACFFVCTGSLACLVFSGLCALLVAPFIGRSVAQQIIGGLSLSFSSIDIGTINGTDKLFPHVVGRVIQPSPFPAVLAPTRALLFASTGAVGAGGDEEMAVVGSVAIPEIQIHPLQDVALDLPLELQVRDPAAFGRAGRRFILAERTTWMIGSSLDVKCWIFGLIPLHLKGISLRKPIELQGLAGFSQDVNPVKMTSVNDAYGEADALDITVSVELHNPSYIAARIARSMQFKVMQRGHTFGTASIQDLALKPGRNVIPLRFKLTSTPTNEDAIRSFILGYIKAEIQPVAVLGTGNSTSDPFLSSILQGLNATFNFQAPPTEFIRSVKAKIGIGISAHVGIYNPLPKAITMGNVDLNIREANNFGTRVFRLNTKNSISNLPGAVLQPQQTSELDISLNPFEVKLTDFNQIGRLLDAAKAGRLVVGVDGPVTITIQPSYTVTVDYSSDNITAELDCPFLCR